MGKKEVGCNMGKEAAVKKQNKLLAHALGILLILSLLLSLTISLPALGAAPDKGPEIAGSFKNMTFQLYQVAEKDKTGNWRACQPFQAYKLNFSLTDDEGKRELAEALVGYIRRDGVKPLQTLVSDAKGTLSFGKTADGLYLIAGDGSSDSAGRKPVPIIIEWPAKESPSSPIRPKYEIPQSSGKSDNLAVHVKKVWQDQNSDQRPASVQVQLLKDKTVIDTVTLNADNNWKKDWYGLARGYNYHVVEKTVPEGYTLSINREGNSFTLTNSKEAPPQKPVPKEPPGDKPPGNDKPPVDKPPQKPLPKLPPSGGKIPQTGQLWWPVGLLAILAVGFSLKGYRLSRQGKRDRS